MSKLFPIVLFILMVGCFISCKKENANAIPKIVIAKPYLDDPKKYVHKQKIPLILSVYDKDALNEVSVTIQKDSILFHQFFPAVTGQAEYALDTFFKLDSVYSTKNYMLCTLKVAATDTKGAIASQISTFKVY